MMIPCNYYINVATPPTAHAAYGVHHSKIELGGCTEKEAIEKFKFYRNLLPIDFNLRLYHVTCYASEVKWIEKESDDDIGYDF